MEKCFLEEEVIVREESKAHLRKSLRLLHQLNIVHCDIKPENIAFSSSFHQPVFIDFGSCRLLPKGPGHKILTSFTGTLSTCSPEMTAPYIRKELGYVDLYHNDAYSLLHSHLGDPNH